MDFKAEVRMCPRVWPMNSILETCNDYVMMCKQLTVKPFGW